MAQLSECEVKGNGLKSKEVTYIPKEIKSGNFKGDCQTAGSIALMIQMILPSLLFGSTHSIVNLRGGTSVSKSPSVRYFQKILFPLLKNFGIEASVKINNEGYYPWGGGEAEIEVEPLKGKGLTPINILQPGKIKNIYIQVITNTNHQEATGNEYMKEIKKEIKKIMRKTYSEEEVDAVDFEMDYHYSESLMKAGLSAKIKERKKAKEKNYHPKEKGPAKIVYGILLFAYGENIYYDCSNVCNDDFTNDEQYIEKVLETFRFYFASGSCMDEHLQDQLLIFMTLANGKSTIRCNKDITEHTNSCFYIFKEFFPQLKYEVTQEKDSGLATIQIEGLGLGVTGQTNSENKEIPSEKKEESKTS
jgi:RNA 3'-terminal phosphate cyclase (ATP)